MVAIPKKVQERFVSFIPKYQKILQNARDRDINESDTVLIVADILAEVFGFDKFTEITSEQAIRGTFCDLAVKQGGSIKYLIEVKAIGLDLKENHLRQAVNYGSTEGIPWVVLTNGMDWEVYRVTLDQKVNYDRVCGFRFGEIAPRKQEDHEKLYLLCKEGIEKDAIEEYYSHVESINRFMIGAIVATDPVIDLLRRELRRVSPGTKVSREEVEKILLSEVLKRDVVEGESAEAAKRRVKKGAGNLLRKRHGEEMADAGDAGDDDSPVI